MRIYKSEKDANINFNTLDNGNSIASITVPAHIRDIEQYFNHFSTDDSIKATSTVQTVEELIGKKQSDLALIVAILVSTGWNRNDDIFTPAEVWKSKSSPLHKPINDNHDEEKILGHIVETRVLDKSGNAINTGTNDSPPDDFDIEVAGVLYRAFPKLSDRIDEIIKKAQAGEIFVSMEAWFPDFSYGILDPSTGNTKIIERTESTAFLTKHLRYYGGSGNYQGFKIGRVLKNMIFGAQGLVNEPANFDSIIKVAANHVVASKSYIDCNINELSEGGIKDMNEEQIKELQAKLEETQKSLASKEEEIGELRKAVKDSDSKDTENQIETLTGKVEELTASLKDGVEKTEQVVTEKNELQKQFDDVQKCANSTKAELDEIRKNTLASERLAKLSEIKTISDEKATIAELRDMTDETFNTVLKYAGEAKSENVNENSDDSSDEVEKEAELTEAALNKVDEDDSADFNVRDDSGKTETDGWLSTANFLCGIDDKEGGE